KVFGLDHPTTLLTQNGLADAYTYVGRAAEAVKLLEECLSLRSKRLSRTHPSTLNTMDGLGWAYREAGQAVRAWPFLEECLRRRKEASGPTHPSTLRTMDGLAWAYREAGTPAKAVPLFEECLRLDTDRPKESRLANLGECLLLAGRPAAAEPVLRECLVLREQARPDDWTTFLTKSLLGDCLLREKKYANAEPLLLAGYMGLKARAASIHAQYRTETLAEAVERLVQLYDATGNKDEAAKWRKKLEEATKAADKEAPKK